MVLPLALPGFAVFFQLFVPGLLVLAADGLVLVHALVFIGGITLLGVLWCLAAGNPEMVVILIQISGLALILIAGRKHEWSGPKVLLAGYAALVLMLFLAMMMGGQDVQAGYHRLVDAVSDDLDRSFQLYMQSSPDRVHADIDLWFRGFKEAVIRFLPGMLALFSLFVSLTNLLTVRRGLSRWFNIYAFAPAFMFWKMPFELVWAVILSGGCAFLLEGMPRLAGENVLLALSGIFFLQGLGIVIFCFREFRVPAFFRWITYFLLMTQWYGLVIIFLLGLFDCWFNFRARVRRPVEK